MGAMTAAVVAAHFYDDLLDGSRQSWIEEKAFRFDIDAADAPGAFAALEQTEARNTGIRWRIKSVETAFFRVGAWPPGRPPGVHGVMPGWAALCSLLKNTGWTIGGVGGERGGEDVTYIAPEGFVEHFTDALTGRPTHYSVKPLKTYCPVESPPPEPSPSESPPDTEVVVRSAHHRIRRDANSIPDLSLPAIQTEIEFRSPQIAIQEPAQGRDHVFQNARFSEMGLPLD